MTRLRRTVRDAIYGVAVGDALGVPVEFKARDSYRIEGMIGGGTYGKPAGTFSDDTSLTLATANSIRICGGIDVDDMRERYRAWLFDGAYVVDGDVFDVGRTTAEALREGRGLDGERDNGNGSLMRAVPLAFVDGITDAQIEAVSAITHAHAIAKHACVIYVRLAQRLLAGASVGEAIAEPVEGRPFERLSGIASFSRDEISSTGYVVDTLEAALWSLATTDSFEDAVLAAVNLGDDTDTVGAVTGGLAGIVYGYDAIPRAWIGALRGRGIMEACLF
ncbi:ADP-ribosylglycohydrolase family protein [Raoultibacter phocaeensis]|uniref:ADP-ribosylglycohydrolase family protein n=1 Tax=Raoultibacter phocaeensis TaxID=2479841 RepID=UPI0011187CD4|nr:ADP-ribosylglycohydrolase family protein [Raoultibacter phocaeensis]